MFLRCAPWWPEGEKREVRRARLVPRRGNWASDVMSQETGVSVSPAADGLCDLGQRTSLSWLLKGREIDFSALISHDPGHQGQVDWWIQ